MKESKKFISREETKELSKVWQREAKEKETGEDGYKYTTDRIVGHSMRKQNISFLHDTWFIEEVIPQMIARKKEGEKVKILDIGGGIGAFAEQIRKQFGEKVEVYTTGLSKKAAKYSMSKALHTNDLKWRSILQLSDYPEFDLIIDTYGEQYYLEPPSFDLDYPVEGMPDIMGKYMQAIARKLKPGGIATIFPFNIHFLDAFIDNRSIDTKFFNRATLEKELGVKIDFDKKTEICRITKLA